MQTILSISSYRVVILELRALNPLVTRFRVCRELRLELRIPTLCTLKNGRCSISHGARLGAPDRPVAPSDG